MAKSPNPGSESLIDRFNRRIEKVDAETREVEIRNEDPVNKKLAEADASQEEDALSNHELLKKYDLPDPETVEEEAGLDRFFEGGMPERLRGLALRRVWRLNPLFRFADEMVEYGEDYTDAATVVEGMQTAYQVGKGYLTKAKEAIGSDTIDSTSGSIDSDGGKAELGDEKNADPKNETGESDHLEGPDDEEAAASSDYMLEQKETN